MKLAGRRIVITGASMGLGRVIARACVREGAHVLLCARTAEPLEEAARELRAAASPGQQVLAKTCDVSDERQVAQLATTAQHELGGCDVLINNAGVLGPVGPLEEVAWEEWKRTLESDLFGVVLPCRAFLPAMKQRGGGKIINISGGGATAARPFVSAYATAKAAVVRLTETLAAELLPFHIDVNAVAPGRMHTRMTQEAIAAGELKIGRDEFESARAIAAGHGDLPENAAQLCVFLAGAESDGITGRLISARWDDWKNLAAHRDELDAGDIYTLRRIVPGDRGATWGVAP